MPSKEKPFKECTLNFLEKTFAIEEVKTLPALEQWLQKPVELSDFERQQLVYLREVLAFNVHDWNEQELDTHFIGPVFTIVNYSSKQFNHFAQRDIEGVVGDYKLYGRPDGLVASGRREPEKPFFAFQEYKRFLDPAGDPAGQALAAMLVGQSMDEYPKPLYGCYVVGQVWRFLLLEGKQYAITPDYSALTDDVFTICQILKALKLLIIEMVEAK